MTDSSSKVAALGGPSQPYDKPTDDLRVVVRCLGLGIPVVVGVQRRHIVQAGPSRSALGATVEDFDCTYIPDPRLALHFLPVKSVWRDLPAVTEAGTSVPRPNDSTNA